MMKLTEIETLAQQGESDILEFKKSTAQLKSAGETLCAFLNNHGGIIFIGVNDNGATLSFAIYENRLEIWSPGLPPDGVTFENIKTLHESISRNRLITKVLYYRKLFESWGRGIQKIITLCTEAGHPEPEFVERTGGVCVILKSKQSIGAPIIYDKQTEERIKLTDRQKEILSIIKEKRQATLPEIIQALTDKAAKRTVQRELARLKDFGLISLRGGTKGSVWEIIAP